MSEKGKSKRVRLRAMVDETQQVDPKYFLKTSNYIT